MSETFETIKAAWPMLKRALMSGQILRPQCEMVEPSDDIHCEYGLEIPMSEGFALTCNVFSSKTARANVGLSKLLRLRATFSAT